jgi:protein gp37
MAGNPNPKIGSANTGLTEVQANGQLDWTGVVRLIEERLIIPLRQRRPRMIFTNSLSDVFHETLDLADIDRFFAVMGLCQFYRRGHIFQVLTKRPSRAAAYVNDPSTPRRVKACMEQIILAHGPFGYSGEALPKMGAGTVRGLELSRTTIGWPFSNIWLGTSVSGGVEDDKMVSAICDARAQVIWLSIEPLVKPYDLPTWSYKHLGWVVVGGESGAGARPMQLEWARDIQRRCKEGGIPFFFKQTGTVLARELGLTHLKGEDLTEVPEDLRVREYPSALPSPTT